jgi:tRNA G18 (ribose-2'-O)-methylase SpoU
MAENFEDNALKPLKWYKALADRKERLESRVFLIEGERAVKQIADNNPDAIVEVLSTDEPPSFCRTYAYRRITGAQLRSITSAATPQGIIAVVAIPGIFIPPLFRTVRAQKSCFWKMSRTREMSAA